MRWLGVVALLILTAAATPAWQWRLPDGVAPPPVPADNAMSAAKVALGRRLFYDADLSVDGTLACAGCHEQKRAFADGNATRPGVHGGPGRRNVPGLANVAWFSRLTIADPAITTLEAQVPVPLTGERPVEMGMKGMEAELPRRRGANACYRRMFLRAFPDHKGRIDRDTVAAALAAFERTMIALDSPYDTWRTGDAAAMVPLAIQGENLFRQKGCATCHAGRDLSDMDYHALEPVQARDPGLIEATGRAQDAGRFRTPSLRNVAVTGPWWHDGTALSMEDAVRRHRLSIADAQMPALVAFLESLTGPGLLTDPALSMPDTYRCE